ncbi:vWA domain-containing protein [Maribacter aurantiacus]|uniref:VWA domain-containing protein n=1 Tax=Maribacter aurantiacus TaxID=1882343 RepID=A0A5R8M5W3_9FLAO|nr:vWA domain-containing protein [Maribacter aurantiacus]TLF44923.1 VWA domain-containing protein [Maribacter aurantiacus]
MQTETVLLVILAAMVAILVALFQYFYRKKKRTRLTLFLAFFRFLGVFGILLLLINPQFAKSTYTIENPVLNILVDNSTSMQEHGTDVNTVLEALNNSENLQNRFAISRFAFGTDLKPLDSLSFKDKYTNIGEPIFSINEAYRRKQGALILISDGNQNVGRDYTYQSGPKKPVYTITVGDTTAYEDLGIGPINTNTYAFLNNKFPVETYVRYQGSGSIATRVQIKVGERTIFSETIELSESNNLKNINTLIDATTVGLKRISVSTSQLPSERNIANNSRETMVEVIDEKTNVGIVSEILHPDLGAFKKAIESNEQRNVTFLKPNALAGTLEEMDIFLLYDPNRSFNAIFQFIKNKKTNYLIITGVNTDFNFLNQVQEDFEVELGYPEQEVFGRPNAAFSNFDISDFDTDDFPPLTSDAGPITMKIPHDVLLDSEIRGVNINSPLLTVMEQESWKKGILAGADIWRWRAQTYRSTGDFTNFDSFMGRLVRYFTASAQRDRLNLEYSNTFEGSNRAIITATYFDQAYIFDPDATLNITITNTENGNSSSRTMAIRSGYYEADLSDLEPGSYEFTVNVEGEGISKNGSFAISDFNLEKQFVSSDHKKMALLANNTHGASFFPDQIDSLIEDLTSNNNYVPTQKSIENIVSLIDYRILLAIIIVAFSTEWFLRKYNGLI